MFNLEYRYKKLEIFIFIQNSVFINHNKKLKFYFYFRRFQPSFIFKIRN